ncbi:MAG: M20 family metallopeptidase [Ancrocorticia sp.]|nr:M20 family metallopeptidase [Ancrocorticia sp.]
MNTDPQRRSELRRIIRNTLANNWPSLVALFHAIHDDPELAYHEYHAAEQLTRILSSAGFHTDMGVYGLPTACEAVFGNGELTATLCAEYDALPGIGHACGHNIIATAAAGAALALAPVAEAADLRIKVLGTPAEEHGGGKVDLLRAGAWEDSSFSLMVHPMGAPDVSADAVKYTAVKRYSVTYYGVASHAAAAPELATNASAVATIALTAMALLRQQLPKTSNINAIVVDGGDVTNIIPGKNELGLEIRAQDLDELADVTRRTLACFEAGAIATGCTWEHHLAENPYAPVANDPLLVTMWDKNLTDTGRQISGGIESSGGSTDMGNVTQVLPALHGVIAIEGCSASPHQEVFREAAASKEGERTAFDAALALAWTALDAALDPAVRSELLLRQAQRPAGATTLETI